MKATTKFFISALVLLLCFVWAEIVRSPRNDGSVHVYFFDVGQGDAELIQRDNIQILIDGGPDEKVLSELGKVMPLSDRNIEYVILTHPHADHLVGLNAVLDHYTIGKIFASGVTHTSDSYLLFLQKIQDKNIDFSVPETGQRLIPFIDGELDFLWPGKQFVNSTTENLNNTSIIGRFCNYSECLFLTGDAEVAEQNDMFNYYEQNKIDYNWTSQILKTAHHGSANGANMKMYEKVLPNITIIEVGADNKYGHPHQALLQLAEQFNNKIYRTDRDSTIELVMGKEGVALKR